ncbi:response regulator [Leptospira sp. GIMC2001]|uniref:response regulator n=1 Tax=Leptospira sp. GIMC2001 TaxID=1513297 RepID=UPI00234AD743|nr:response regulator [Leptospira sp. GIMC2001]WCL49054.1 response regulator [Leptospira sp. GIMC2001]
MKKPIFLCVDDEESILDTLKEQLRAGFGEEFTYETAESADEAQEIIAEIENPNERVVLIVSDWLMPGMKGDEFLVNIQKDYPNIKKVLLTGQADPASIERAKTEGQIQAVMAKPWTKDGLISSIKEILAGAA